MKYGKTFYFPEKKGRKPQNIIYEMKRGNRRIHFQSYTNTREQRLMLRDPHQRKLAIAEMEAHRAQKYRETIEGAARRDNNPLPPIEETKPETTQTAEHSWISIPAAVRDPPKAKGKGKKGSKAGKTFGKGSGKKSHGKGSAWGNEWEETVSTEREFWDEGEIQYSRPRTKGTKKGGKGKKSSKGPGY